MTGVVLSEVTKVYPDGTEAVREVSLDVPEGAFMVFVGPSGCGKTTILRMIAGLEDITEGTIAIGDRIVNGIEPQDRDCAIVFQSYALYPHMTVYNNLAFGLRMRKIRRAEIDRRVREAAGILGLSDMLQKRPRHLSGGQRQRVAMGRAIVREPQVFLMDEPLSNLDAKLRVQVRTEILRLQRRLGVTTIYVTHDQIEATTMGDLVGVMRDGVLQQVGTPQTLYKQPANVFVASFIGSPGMNLCEAKVTDSEGETRVEFGGHRLKLSDATLRSHGAIGRFVGKKVIVGIRPEALIDAALVPSMADDVIVTSVDVCEDLGAEILAHFIVKSPPGSVGERDATLDALGGEESSLATEFIARLGVRSAVREKDEIRLAVDIKGVHLFDPETGGGLY